MNRRGFLRALGLGAAAVALAPYLPELPPPVVCVMAPKTIYGVVPITFKGIPIVYDSMCPPNNIYFQSANAHRDAWPY